MNKCRCDYLKVTVPTPLFQNSERKIFRSGFSYYILWMELPSNSTRDLFSGRIFQFESLGICERGQISIPYNKNLRRAFF